MTDTDEVVDALEHQLGCYRRLAKLVQLQHGHVEQNEIEPLIEVLLKRQAVLEQITELEHVVGPAKRDWLGYVKGIGPERRDRAEQFLSQVRQLLEQITARSM